jgi:hypothetical protein
MLLILRQKVTQGHIESITYPLRTCTLMRGFVSSAVVALAAAQDPANGWMAYAVGDISSTGAERITRLEMTWAVSESPARSRAFFAPWFGMDPADNLNLIQPVNPWGGDSWSMYTEYFQWR